MNDGVRGAAEQALWRLWTQHFGALSGCGQVHFRLEQYEKALAWWRRALRVNPNMPGVAMNIDALEELLREKKARSV